MRGARLCCKILSDHQGWYPSAGAKPNILYSSEILQQSHFRMVSRDRLTGLPTSHEPTQLGGCKVRSRLQRGGRNPGETRSSVFCIRISHQKSPRESGP